MSAPSSAPSVAALLSAVPASTFRLPAHGALVQVPSTLSVADTLKALNDANVTGAPVYDEVATESSASLYTHGVLLHTRKYIGFVDVSDLALLITSKGLERPVPEGFLAKVGNLFSTDWEHTVGKAVNVSEHDPFYGLPLTGNLAQAAKVFAKGFHRVAVVDPDRDMSVVGIITSSHVLRAVHDNLSVLGPLASMTVGALFPTGPGQVTCCSQGDTAQACFSALVQRKHLGMPVCDAAGAVVANLSASDIRRVSGMSAADTAAALGLGVLQFLSTVGATGADKAAVRAPVTVMATDRFDSVIRVLVAAQVHRVYIVDDARRPIGIVSVTDIIRLLLSPTVTTYSDGLGTVGGAAAAGAGAGAEADATGLVDGSVIHPFLHGITAQEFVTRSGVVMEDGVVEMRTDASVVEVLALLAKHRVSSVAVYEDAPIPMTGMYAGPSFVGAYVPATEKKYVGWLDAADVTKLLLARGLSAHSSSIMSWFSKDTEHSAAAAVNFSHADPFCAVDVKRPLTSVIRILARPLHRIAVVDADHSRHITGIITQSAMVAFLAEHKTEMSALAGLTLSRLSVLTSSAHAVAVVTVPDSSTVRDAFAVLLAHNIGGVPVVDGTGAIVANVSLTDVRRLSTCTTDAELQAALGSNVLEYLRRPVAGSTASPSLSPLVLHGGDSLGTAIELLAASHRHRLYVVEGRRPVGFITLATVLQAVAAAIEPHRPRSNAFASSV